MGFLGEPDFKQSALPYLKRTPGARVVSMSSASSVYGTAHLAAYSATKAAVSSLTVMI